MALTFTFTVSSPAPPVIDDVDAEDPSPDAINGATALRDMELDEDGDGDLVFEEGDVVFNKGIEAIASDVKSRCLTFGPGTDAEGDQIDGECFLDTTIGVNYWGSVFRGAVNQSDAAAAFITEIAKTPGVLEVFDVVADIVSREFSLSFRALTDLGLVISATLSETQEG